MNHVSLTGNVTRDPDVRFTTGGRATCSFGLAVNRRYQQNGEWQEVVSFFDVSCWADLAEHVAQTIRKGDRVMVSGRLEQQTWEDKETGKNRSKVEVVADEVGASLRFATAVIARVERSKVAAS